MIFYIKKKDLYVIYHYILYIIMYIFPVMIYYLLCIEHEYLINVNRFESITIFFDMINFKYLNRNSWAEIDNLLHVCIHIYLYILNSWKAMSSFYFYTIYYFYTSIRLILRSQCPPVKNGNNFVVRYNKMLLCYLQLSIYTYMFEMFIFWKLLLKALVNETIVCRLRLHLLTSSFLRVNFLFFPIQYHSQIFDETCLFLIGKFATLYYIC